LVHEGVLIHLRVYLDRLSILSRAVVAKVQLLKPRAGHAKRTSFYMVATQVQSHSAEAVGAVQRWRQIWRAATFGTDEEYSAALRERLAVERC